MMNLQCLLRLFCCTGIMVKIIQVLPLYLDFQWIIHLFHFVFGLQRILYVIMFNRWEVCVFPYKRTDKICIVNYPEMVIKFFSLFIFILQCSEMYYRWKSTQKDCLEITLLFVAQESVIYWKLMVVECL